MVCGVVTVRKNWLRGMLGHCLEEEVIFVDTVSREILLEFTANLYILYYILNLATCAVVLYY